MDVMSLMTDMATALGEDVYVRQSRAMQRRKDQQDIMCRIKQPTLVMCSDYNGQHSVRRHEFLTELIPYTQLEVIPNAGHIPTLENPDAVTDAIRRRMRPPLVLR